VSKTGFLENRSFEDLKKEISFFIMIPLGESLESQFLRILRFKKTSGK
jgi:hypothetical protein